MIVDPVADSTDDKKQVSASSQLGEASISNPAPPPFESSQQDHELVDISGTESTPLIHTSPTDRALGPPPEFAPYNAEHFSLDNQDIVSHDPHLNSDGEALYRFLLSESHTSPSYLLHCHGTHSETRSRWVQERDSHGHSRSRRETYSEVVTDFDFYIEIFPDMSEGREPIQWSVRDDEPAYRGKMVREYEQSSPSFNNIQHGKRIATRKEAKKYKNWIKTRTRLGFPPWIQEEDMGRIYMDPAALPQVDALRSSKTLRQWADEYCASPKYLKEFVYEKILYGWNMEQIENVIRSTIKLTPYNGSLDVNIYPRGSKIFIRPNNKVSRMLSNKWLKFLSIILFIFPFVWLFKRFHSRGGGRWEVCGGAYPLKQWVPLDDGEEIPPGTDRTQRYMQTPTGPRKLIGQKEGEWFRVWEGVIKRAVIGRYQSPVPLPPSSLHPVEASLLDGYNEGPSLVEY
ncbi:hypothetical protein BDN70DRAFT_864604 [Pholiota conissans]|uniref:Uncharacterized protein n=1 Tax=Pholiota conissans TaxID=109636 RepID=A0A9P6CQZ7_9AGAR|nr:hypothetical protein BDN70DRAFT_864604 [Pholiota conissans]